VRVKKPNLVFLIETKLLHSISKMEAVKSKLRFDGLFVVDCHGRSGGLALLWNLDIQVCIENYNMRHINAVIQSESAGKEWKFTVFYGHLEVAKRPNSWALLRYLSRMALEPWLCVGDFNEITSASEKSSSSVRPPN
jgi:hypothetical protein